MSGRVWKAVKAEIREVRMAEAKGGGSQEGSRKKMGRMGGKEVEKGKDVRSKENSRRVGDLG